MLYTIEKIVEEIRRNPRLVIADDYELSIQHTVGESHHFNNGEEKSQNFEDSTWISLRLLHRNKPGRSATLLRTKEALEDLVESAFNSANHSGVDPWFRLPILKSPHKFDSDKTVRFSNGEISSLYSEVTYRPDIIKEDYENCEIAATIFRKMEKIRLTHKTRINTCRFSILDHSGDYYFWLRESRSFSKPSVNRIQLLKALLNRSARKKAAKVLVPKGSWDLLMSPIVASALLKEISPWFCADLIQCGRSPLIDRLGTKIGSEKITILDDGNVDGGAGSIPFDSEGALSQRTTLIDHGIVSDFLYDTYTATRENRLSTGNFIRCAPSMTACIGASNCFVEPGSLSENDLMGLLHRGIWLDTVFSLELISGRQTEFLLRGSGWTVERGKCVAPLREISIVIDAFELLKKTIEVGNDLSFYGPFGSPSILFENIPLSA